jgi:hypothetical protein
MVIKTSDIIRKDSSENYSENINPVIVKELERVEFVKKYKGSGKDFKKYFLKEFGNFSRRVDKILLQENYDLEKTKNRIFNEYKYYVLLDFTHKDVSFYEMGDYDFSKNLANYEYYQIFKPVEFAEIVSSSITIKYKGWFAKKQVLDLEATLEKINNSFTVEVGKFFSDIILVEEFFKENDFEKRMSFNLLVNDDFLDCVGKEGFLYLFKNIYRKSFSYDEYNQYLTFKKYSIKDVEEIKEENDSFVDFVTSDYEILLYYVILYNLFIKDQDVNCEDLLEVFGDSFFFITERDVRSLQRIYNLDLKTVEDKFKTYVLEINDSFAQLDNILSTNQIYKSKTNNPLKDVFDILDSYNDTIRSLDFLNNKNKLKIGRHTTKALLNGRDLDGIDLQSLISFLSKDIFSADFNNSTETRGGKDVLVIENHYLSAFRYYSDHFDQNSIERVCEYTPELLDDLLSLRDRHKFSFGGIEYQLIPIKLTYISNQPNATINRNTLDVLLKQFDRIVQEKTGLIDIVSGFEVVDQENKQIKIPLISDISLVLKNTVVI